MEENVRKRIQILLTEKNCTVYSLGGDSTSLQRKLGNQLKGSTTISVDTILLVLDKFPDVSAEWLLRGHGTMYGREETTVINNASTTIGNANAGGSQDIRAVDEIMKAKDCMIDELKHDKQMLTELLMNLTKK